MMTHCPVLMERYHWNKDLAKVSKLFEELLQAILHAAAPIVNLQVIYTKLIAEATNPDVIVLSNAIGWIEIDNEILIQIILHLLFTIVLTDPSNCLSFPVFQVAQSATQMCNYIASLLWASSPAKFSRDKDFCHVHAVDNVFN